MAMSCKYLFLISSFSQTLSLEINVTDNRFEECFHHDHFKDRRKDVPENKYKQIKGHRDQYKFSRKFIVNYRKLLQPFLVGDWVEEATKLFTDNIPTFKLFYFNYHWHYSIIHSHYYVSRTQRKN